MIPGSDQDSPQYLLRVSHCGAMEIHEAISVLHGRVIAVLALEGEMHCRDFPEHISFIMGKIALEIEAALQHRITSHSRWLNLCDNCDSEEQTIQVQLEVIPAAHSGTTNAFSGGIGGAGGLFGAGGGGGGAGLLDGGAGGFGADGAALVFQIAHDNSLLDIDAFVTPGTFDAALRPDAHRVKVVAIGGGGGGGSGGPSLNRWRSLASGE